MTRESLPSTAEAETAALLSGHDPTERIVGLHPGARSCPICCLPMLLRFPLLAALLVCSAAAAQPSAAQPSAADSALVERVIVALDFSPMAESDVEAPVTPAVARAALYADLQPALLLGVVRFLESPEHAVWNERFRRIGAAEEAVDSGHVAPPGVALADEALARRYIASTGLVAERVRFLEQAFDDMERLPGYATTLEQIGVHPDAVRSLIAETRRAEGEAALVAGAREVLAGVAAADVEQIVAFNESAGARYLRETMARSSRTLLLAASQGVIEETAGTILDELVAGFIDAGWAFSTADKAPELVGGLARVQRLVVYPTSARSEGVEGRVLIAFVVDEKGTPVEAVATESPDARLSEAALAALAQARFTPGRVRGHVVRVRMVVPIRFSLSDAPPSGLRDG